MKPIDIVCAGIVIADVVARPVRDLPGRGELALVDDVSLQLGGSAANTGAQLVKLGQRVAVAGRVGRDSFGAVMRADLKRLGLEVTDLHEDASAPSSATVVHVDSVGERSFLHAIGANAQVRCANFRLREWQAAGGLCASAVGGTAGLESFGTTWALAKTLTVTPLSSWPLSKGES